MPKIRPCCIGARL